MTPNLIRLCRFVFLQLPLSILFLLEPLYSPHPMCHVMTVQSCKMYDSDAGVTWPYFCYEEHVAPETRTQEENRWKYYQITTIGRMVDILIQLCYLKCSRLPFNDILQSLDTKENWVLALVRVLFLQISQQKYKFTFYSNAPINLQMGTLNRATADWNICFKVL